MERICLVCLDNTKYAPYIQTYLQLCENTTVEAIVWDREGLEETHFHKSYLYHTPKTVNSKFSKLWGYLGFRLFATSIISKKSYDRIILTTANAAVLLSTVLKGKYCGKYIVDVRDYFMENNPLYYQVEKSVIEKSGMVVISSPAYRKFLPKHNYYVWNNVSSFPEIERPVESPKNKITLTYVGTIRFIENDIKTIELFKNDDRFHLEYIGRNSEVLSKYCTLNDINNVAFKGTFEPSALLEQYSNTDMILNLYGNGTPLLDYALSNKIYHAAYLRKPILVFPKTYMEEVSVKSGFGFAIDFSDTSIKDKLYSYYQNYDRGGLARNCDIFLQETFQENRSTFSAVKRFIHSDKYENLEPFSNK